MIQNNIGPSEVMPNVVCEKLLKHMSTFPKYEVIAFDINWLACKIHPLLTVLTSNVRDVISWKAWKNKVYLYTYYKNLQTKDEVMAKQVNKPYLLKCNFKIYKLMQKCFIRRKKGKIPLYNECIFLEKSVCAYWWFCE